MSVARTAFFACTIALLTCAGCDKPSTPPPAQPQPGTQTAAVPAAPRTLPSGLIITDTLVGTGTECPPGADVTVNFTAKLADGTIYDSTDKRKRSWTIPLSNPNVIAGLREGIPGMKIGGKRTLLIPWTLAYGELGRDPVPPKNDLTFEIELLSWEPGKPEAPTTD